MASPEPSRKGWGRGGRVAMIAVIAGIAMLPVSLFVGALLTPTLWRLEAVLGTELGGHSGPAEWVLVTIWGILTAAATISVVVLRRRHL